MDRDHIHITFISILLQLFYFIISVVNLLLSLIYKLNFIIGMYIGWTKVAIQFIWKKYNK